MFSPGPRATLLLFLSLAAVIFAGGLRLARHEESVRLDRDNEPLRRFWSDAQSELRRLDELYENHLASLARTISNDAIKLRGDAARIVGVRQVSLLHREAAFGVNDLHVQTASSERISAPTFTRTGSNSVLLDSAKIFSNDAVRRGWIDAPGKPLMFWLRQSSDEVAVLTLDSQEVEAAISNRLEKWAAASFEPVRAAAGPDQLRNHQGRALAASGETPGSRPDLLLPLSSRLGVWEIVSWDRREIRAGYDAASLSASGTVAVLTALLGVLVFGQQRRASVLAAQQVSFVNQASHELRSPLTNILLNVDLAAEAVQERPQDAVRRLGLVQEEARRLGRLIDNVLTFSRHEQGKLCAEPRECFPANIIASVAEQFAPSFARRALAVRATAISSAACLLDADAFAQILSNLLSNVEKYVAGGVVDIAMTLADGALTLTVADDGPGIPAAAAERIFRPFERLQSAVNEGASGTGLGLTIARGLATSMGGSLTLLASERGACFQLRLPALSPPSAVA